MKAVRKGFLKECPNINEKLILKYLNPNPATAKGHMKRPHHGIKSTTPRVKPTQPPIHVPVITFPLQPVESIGGNSEQTTVHNAQRPNLIGDDRDKSIANVFGFGAFADKKWYCLP